jgi:hypothetical protein
VTRSRRNIAITPATVAGTIGAAVLIVGTFLPWIDGTSGIRASADAEFALVAGGLGLYGFLWLGQRAGYAVAIAAGLIGAITTSVDAAGLAPAGLGSPGIGLYVSLVGAIAQAVAGAIEWLRPRRSAPSPRSGAG